MAQEQHAFLMRAEVPSRDAWQAAVDALGFDLQIWPELVPFESSGFLTCRLNGRDSGFEIYYETPEELVAGYPNIEERVRGKDFCISFRYGRIEEFACVSIVLAALAGTFNAVVYYPDDALFYDAVTAAKEAHEAIAELDKPPPLAKRKNSIAARLGREFGWLLGSRKPKG